MRSPFYSFCSRFHPKTTNDRPVQGKRSVFPCFQERESVDYHQHAGSKSLYRGFRWTDMFLPHAAPPDSIMACPGRC